MGFLRRGFIEGFFLDFPFGVELFDCYGLVLDIDLSSRELGGPSLKHARHVIQLLALVGNGLFRFRHSGIFTVAYRQQSFVVILCLLEPGFVIFIGQFLFSQVFCFPVIVGFLEISEFLFEARNLIFDFSDYLVMSQALGIQLFGQVLLFRLVIQG